MKLTIDARLLTASGIGVYIQNIISTLEHRDYDLHLLHKEEDKQMLSKLLPHYQGEVYNAGLYSINELIATPFKTRNTDIFWSPHFNIPVLNFASRLKIVTIHDVFHLAFFHTLTLKQKLYAKLMIQRAVQYSDLIFTVSEFSKREIIKYTNCKADKIKVVYNGIDFNKFNDRLDNALSQDVFKTRNINHPYILFVGNVKPHKNLSAALKGFREFIENSAQFSETRFVIVGKRAGFVTGDNEINALLSDSFYASKVQFTEWVKEEELRVLYQNAQAFIFPSIYEGFGFPSLEAMAAGCPVISSNAACMPEIYGTAASYFNPFNTKEIGEKLYGVLHDTELRSELIKKGLAQARKYSWEDTVNQMLVHLKDFLPVSTVKESKFT